MRHEDLEKTMKLAGMLSDLGNTIHSMAQDNVGMHSLYQALCDDAANRIHEVDDKLEAISKRLARLEEHIDPDCTAHVTGYGKHNLDHKPIDYPA